MANKVAVAQMVSSTSVFDNLDKVAQLAKQARKMKAGLLLLPENFAFMGRDEADKLKIAETPGEGPIQDRIRSLAKEMGLWIIAGTIPVKSEGSRVYAASLVFDDTGQMIARYDKIHLFDVRVSEHESHQESNMTCPGEQVCVLATPFGNIGMSVCYDLRFPELYRQLIIKGAELFTAPSAFTEVTGRAHWEILLKSRAIENLSYLLAANQGGQHENGRATYGHSMIIDPWGKTLAALEKGEGIITADIDLQRLADIRAQFPTNEHHVMKSPEVC